MVPAAPAPNDETNPSDELVVAMLKQYLAGQDRKFQLHPISTSRRACIDWLRLYFTVMQLSKRQARDGLAKLFPNADLSTRKEFINSQIDAILSGNL
jgi:chitin synthase